MVKTLQEEREEKQQCIHCGTDLEMGYGMAGGGMGPYLYCPNENCKEPTFEKFQDPEMS